MTLIERVVTVKQRMADAARRSDRNPEGIRLIAVTKTIPAPAVQEAVDAGIRDLGENRVQEAKLKIPSVRGEATWHLIGHLQTNKAKEAVELFSLIHSIDRWDLAEKISQEGVKRGRVVEGLVQVNVAREATKGGFALEEVPGALKKLASLPNLSLRGLMTIAPLVKDPEEVRPVFRELKVLFDRLPTLTSYPLSLISWNCLSMGMSNDFEVAIEEGATMVRIGTAIFGPS